MSWFFIVTKFIVLKILLASPSGLSGYEFGYHPSAEEFDSLLRETGRTWTRDLLANERRRAWTPSTLNEEGHYKPKYNYENEHNRYASAQPHWQEHVQKWGHLQDQANAANVPAPAITLNQIGSTLDFNMFSGETNGVIVGNEVSPSRGNNTLRPDLVRRRNETNLHATVPTTVEIGDQAESQTNKFPSTHSISHTHQNSSDGNFPIFFTNPATGIVYAITEIGKVPHNITPTNDTIPIYVTKEQYERDLYLLGKHYESICRPTFNRDKDQFPNSNHSALSMPSNTTVRPQIIRLKRPMNTIPQPFNGKLPIHLHKPPPVMVQTGVAVSDQVQLPTKHKNPSKYKKRKKKTRRPGRKPAVSTVTHKSVMPSSTSRPQYPNIILGTRSTTPKPNLNTDRLSTQLEKPTLHNTIFSQQPLVATSGYMFITDPRREPSVYSPHRVYRRDVTNVQEDSAIPNKTDKEFAPDASAKISWKTQQPAPVRQSHAFPTKRLKIPRHRNRTIVDGLRVLNRNHTHTSHNTKRHKTNSIAIITPNNHTTAIPKVETLPHNTTKKSLTTERHFDDSSKDKRTKRKGKKKKKKKSQHKDQISDSGFDLFGFGDDGGDNDDYDDSYYDYDEKDRHSKAGTESHQPHTEHPFEHKDTHVTEDNSSSAEESADYGAMETAEETSDENLSSITKNTSGKKRIRRRPSTAAEYDDNADDDDVADTAIGGFFRMIFYPVQLVMYRILDSFGDNGNAQSSKPKYPTYTLYNNALDKDGSSEEDDVKPNSFSSWFSSWVGFNRKTKKVGSTTVMPLPAPAPTEEPGWFESWFGAGKTTTESSEEDYDEYDKWFYGWFGDARPKRRSSSTTTAPTPQVPILTIVDPLKNPHSWIGILAHHIINATTTTTNNPLIEALTRVTTENPDIPRKVSYDKYQIWRLKPQDDAQVKALEEYKKTEEGLRLQWLKGPTLRGLTDVLVPPKMLIDFQGSLNFDSIAHEVLIFDVGKAITYEKSKEQFFFSTTQRPHKHHKAPQLTLSWHKYYEYNEIVKYLESIRIRHPQIVELIHIGRSYEGRPLIIVKIESKQSLATAATVQPVHKKLKNKKQSNQANAAFIVGGVHGMEWIGPATTTWMINELLRIMKSNKTSAEQEFIKNTTWYIMPVLNPDGYVYSHEYDRFWRKSRSRHISRDNGIITSAMTWLQQKKVPEKVCYGVDLDRNWHYQWGRVGSSKAPCNELYAGPVPFSEPETKALSEFLMDYRTQIKLFISMQSYGQVISYPIRANYSFNSERMDDFLDVASVGTDGLRKKGSKSRYKIDSSSDLVEHRSGCSDAFAAYEVGIPFSYTMQLADNGVHGYLLPSASIEPTAKDAFEIVTAMLDYI